jgi:nucleoside-diphosphate-sugar epimerase
MILVTGAAGHMGRAVFRRLASFGRDLVGGCLSDTDELSRFYFLPVYRDPERRLAVCSVPSTILRFGVESGGAPK